MTLEPWQQWAARDPQEWLRRSVLYFEQFGFYRTLVGLPDAERVRAVATLMARHGDVPLLENPADDMPLADQYLLSGDETRVWWHDLEVVYPGADAYPAVLAEWAAIARGALPLQTATESWPTPRQPVITYRVNGRTHRFVPGPHAGDYLDLRLLRDLNQILAPSGLSFVVCDRGGMPNFVTVLTDAERTRLMAERGWDPYPLPR